MLDLLVFTRDPLWQEAGCDWGAALNSDKGARVKVCKLTVISTKVQPPVPYISQHVDTILEDVRDNNVTFVSFTTIGSAVIASLSAIVLA